MKRLEQLPDIASRQLGGLEATPTLLCRIKLEAAEKKSDKSIRRAALRPVLAVCCALVLCVGAAMTLGGEDHPLSMRPVPTENVMDSRAAGSEAQPTSEPVLLADVPKGSISMSAGAKRVQGSLFVSAEGSAFPLVTLDGATYRMLEKPNGVSRALLGDEMGTVSEFNIEPALGSGGVVSNAVSMGQSVYAVGDLGGALVAADVDGSLRVFQRVSYAGTAVIGTETLRDTLCAPDDVEWIELDGKGRAEGEKARHLMETLLDGADYQSTAYSGDAFMRIGLTNGLTLQLMTGEDTVSACGTWSCPDFFEAWQN